MEKARNNRKEAQALIDFAGMKFNEAKLVLPMLDCMLIDKRPKNLDMWNWEIAKLLADRTSYIFVDTNYDGDFELGENGELIKVGDTEKLSGIEIKDKDNLMFLRQEADDILNHTNDKISQFISMENKPKWKCKNCRRVFDKTLSSADEIKKLLRKFSTGSYWDCFFCKTPNYFEFTDDGIVFKIGA